MSNIHTPTDQVLSKCIDIGVFATQPSQGIDTRGFTRAKFIIAANTAASSTLDASLAESSDDGVNVPFATIAGSAISTIVSSSTRSVRVISVNLDNRERYLRVQEVVTGTVTGYIGVELYNADEMPVVQDFPPTVL